MRQGVGRVGIGVGAGAAAAVGQVGLVGDIADVVIGDGFDQARRAGQAGRPAGGVVDQTVELVVAEVLRRP